MQAHQGFLRAFNSVTSATQTKNNIMEAWTTMSGVPAEAVTRWEALLPVWAGPCAHTPCASGRAAAPSNAPLSLPQGALAACRVLCAGFSLGAALATLCGPWAQGSVVQAQVEVVTGGSPRVFNPAAAAYYDKNVRNVYRVVNNKDIVPSLPPAQSG